MSNKGGVVMEINTGVVLPNRKTFIVLCKGVNGPRCHSISHTICMVFPPADPYSDSVRRFSAYNSSFPLEYYQISSAVPPNDGKKNTFSGS